MGFKHPVFLSGSSVYSCAECKVHLSTVEQILSRSFQGQHGRAYLFDKVVNVTEGVAEDRAMTTGLHTVRDITCSKCGALLGWKYDKAYEYTQRYKEGRFILEKAQLTTSSH